MNNPMVPTSSSGGGGGGGGSLTLTDGDDSVSSVTQITVTGGTVGGTTPNATLTIGGNTLTLTADTNLAAGTAVSLNSVGHAVQTFAPARSSAVVLLQGAADISSINNPAALKLDANHFVAFVSNIEGAPLAAAVAGTISTGSSPPITIGTPNTSDAGLIGVQTAVALSGTAMLVFYAGNVEFVNVSGNAFSNITNIAVPDVTTWLAATALTSTLVVAVYVDGSGNLKVVAISVSGTTPSPGTAIQIGGGPSVPFPLTASIARITNTSYLAVFCDFANSHAMTAIAGSVSGNTITNGSTATSGVGYFVSQVQVLSTTQFAVSFVANPGNYGGDYTVSGGTISTLALTWTGSPIVYPGAATNSTSGSPIGPPDEAAFGGLFLPMTSAAPDETHATFAVRGSYPVTYSYSLGAPTGPSKLPARPVTPLAYGTNGFGLPTNINGVVAPSSSQITVADGVNGVFSMTTSGGVSPTVYSPFAWGQTIYPVDSTHALLIYGDTTNSVVGEILAIGSINSPPIGCVASAVMSGNPATITLSGACSGFSGLTPGAQYFANGDGTVTTGDTGHPVGVAATATQMIVQ